MRRYFFMLTSVGLVLAAIAQQSPAEELTAKDYTDFWRPVVGNWKMTDEMGGETTTGIFRFHVAPNKKCILLYHGAPGAPYTQQLQGYDPVTKKLIAVGFRDTGDYQIQTIIIDGMEKGKIAAKGIGGSWEMKVFGTDGKTTITTSKWSFEDVGKKRVVMLWSDMKEDGKPVPELRMTLERQE